MAEQTTTTESAVPSAPLAARVVFITRHDDRDETVSPLQKPEPIPWQLAFWEMDNADKPIVLSPSRESLNNLGQVRIGGPKIMKAKTEFHPDWVYYPFNTMTQVLDKMKNNISATELFGEGLERLFNCNLRNRKIVVYDERTLEFLEPYFKEVETAPGRIYTFPEVIKFDPVIVSAKTKNKPKKHRNHLIPNEKSSRRGRKSLVRKCDTPYGKMENTEKEKE